MQLLIRESSHPRWRLTAASKLSLLLGRVKLDIGVRYLGIEVDSVFEMAEQTEVWATVGPDRNGHRSATKRRSVCTLGEMARTSAAENDFVLA